VVSSAKTSAAIRVAENRFIPVSDRRRGHLVPQSCRTGPLPKPWSLHFAVQPSDAAWAQLLE
jgi:hypothetical protein